MKYLTFLFITYSSIHSYASGCTAEYDFYINSETPYKTVSNKNYKLIKQNSSHLVIEYNNRQYILLKTYVFDKVTISKDVPNQPGLQLSYKAVAKEETLSGKTYRTHQLILDDVSFTEGEVSCGPMFECTTGRLRLIVKDSKLRKNALYSWPPLREATYDLSENEYLSNSLLPNFADRPLPKQPTPEAPQCSYGLW